MDDFTASEIRSYYAYRTPSLKITRAREWRGPCPIHGGKDDNFAVNSETGAAFCHSRCSKGWDILGLEQELSGLGFVAAKEAVYSVVGRPKPSWEERDIVATYDYTDADGQLLYQVVRKTGKNFMQRRPDGAGGWMWGLGGVSPVPFQLPLVAKSKFVAIAEGEKDALTLTRIGIPATTNNGGAKNFKSDLVLYFSGKKVALFPDNDDKGREHALFVAGLLKPVAESVKIVELPGLPHKGDITDFVQKGGTKDQIRELYAKAQEWTPEWQFGSNTPDPNDQYVRTMAQVIEASGGVEKFWDLRRHEGLDTPWSKLTRSLGGGMRRGEVYVIGGNQGSGKTSLALQFGTHAIRKHKGVLMFSMEMGWEDVFQRICSIQAAVNLNELREAQLHRSSGPDLDLQAMLSDLSKITSELKELPLFVSNKTGVNPEYLLNESLRWKERERIELVIVDHMQLMSSTGSTRGDYEKFTAISRATKETAMQLKVPVLLVSQTSRSNSRDRRWELDVSDLRGSGAIEEDAATVMLLYPDKDDAEAAMQTDDGRRWTRGPVKTWLKLGKNRFGEQGLYMPMVHFKTITRFEQAEADGATA